MTIDRLLDIAHAAVGLTQDDAPLPREGGREGQPPIPLPGAGDPKVMRRVAWVLNPRPLLESDQ